jgi:hypothetical protein
VGVVLPAVIGGWSAVVVRHDCSSLKVRTPVRAPTHQRGNIDAARPGRRQTAPVRTLALAARH